MAKPPAFQFYVRDWLTDQQLLLVSFDVKGVWIDMLCMMWLAPIKGELTCDMGSFVSRICHGDVTLGHKFVTEIQEHRFGDFERKPDGTLVFRNRRMYNDYGKTMAATERKRRQREREKQARCHANVTHTSASASASANKKGVMLYDTQEGVEAKKTPHNRDASHISEPTAIQDVAGGILKAATRNSGKIPKLTPVEGGKQ